MMHPFCKLGMHEQRVVVGQAGDIDGPMWGELVIYCPRCLAEIDAWSWPVEHGQRPLLLEV